MINVDSSKPIKSKLVRVILIAGLTIFVILICVGLFSTRLDDVGPVKFHHDAKTDSTKQIPRVENNSDIQIQKMNGDIIKDSATKNVYNYK